MTQDHRKDNRSCKWPFYTYILTFRVSPPNCKSGLLLSLDLILPTDWAEQSLLLRMWLVILDFWYYTYYRQHLKSSTTKVHRDIFNIKSIGVFVIGVGTLLSFFSSSPVIKSTSKADIALYIPTKKNEQVKKKYIPKTPVRERLRTDAGGSVGASLCANPNRHPTY